ncbi:MAG: Ig-like domain-containing protein [Candidatus Saliniplasma sp.]
MVLCNTKKSSILALFLIFSLAISSFTLGVSTSQSESETGLEIELDSPTDGNVWSGSSDQNISWTLNTSLELNEIELTLEYVFDGDGPYLIKRYEKGELTNYSSNYTWNVPNMDSDEVHIILRAEGGGYKRWKMVSIDIDSTSPEFFYSVPENEEVLLSDSPIELTFSEEIDLEEFRNSFTLYGPSEVVDGSVSSEFRDDNFTVEFIPDKELDPSSDYYFELSGLINDTSDPGNPLEIDLGAHFTVQRGPPLVDISTSMEDMIRIGTNIEINWTVDQQELADEPVDISYSADGGDTWINIVNGLENLGTYTWEVPKEPMFDYPVSDVILNVSCENEYGFTGYSHSKSFMIYENLEPVVEVERPYEGIVLVEGQETEIRWNATDDIALPKNPITLSISTDGGSSWRVISYDVENEGVYNWQIDVSAENAILNVSCTDVDGDMSWTHSPEFTILEENPLELSLDPVKDSYHARESITVNWVAPPLVEDHQYTRVYFSNDGEMWSLMDEVESDETSTDIRFPFAMSSRCSILLEVLDETGPIYSVESEGFEVFPEIQDMTQSEMGNSTMIHISFGSYVSRGLIEDCLVLYRDGEKIEIARNEIYAMSGSDIVFIKEGLPQGQYTLKLNSSDSNVEFNDRVIYTFEKGDSEEKAYVTYWPVLLLVPVIAFLLYTYKIKINSNDEKYKYKFRR